MILVRGLAVAWSWCVILVRGLARGAWPGPWCVILVRGLAVVRDFGAWPGPGA